MKAPIKRLAALVAAVGAIAAFPGVASAASCSYVPVTTSDPSLVDSQGFHWDLRSDGAIDNGFELTSGRSDAFDIFGRLAVSTDGGFTVGAYTNPNVNGCATEEGGREVVFPNDVLTAPGIALGHRVYVPEAGLAFARFVDELTNTGQATRSVLYRWGGELGSDENTAVAGTSTGDTNVTRADSWANTFENTQAKPDPTVTTVWDGTSAPITRADEAGRFEHDLIGFEYQYSPDSEYIGTQYEVTLAPGETKRFMHFVAMRLTAGDQAAAAASIGDEPQQLWAGLTAAEIESIQNWDYDTDRDAVRTRVDNCPATPNAGQGDLDGDGKGDACDEDVDGDGLTNAAEQALRTDPLKADTDGDGRSDSADSCPTLAAATDDGCPMPVTSREGQSQAPDTTAPLAAVTVAKKISLKKLLRKGIVVKVGSNEPVSFDVEVAAAAKSARLAQVGDLILSAKTLAIGGGQRSVKLTIAKKFRKALTTKSRLRLKVVATDAAGNRTATARAIKLAR